MQVEGRFLPVLGIEATMRFEQLQFLSFALFKCSSPFSNIIFLFVEGRHSSEMRSEIGGSICLLAKSTKFQPLKIKNAPGSFLEQEKRPWKIIPESF